MNWWSRFCRRKQMEDQLEKELRFHLDQHTSDLISRGYASEQARRQARLTLGGPEQVKEQCRDVRGHAGWRICCRTPAMHCVRSGKSLDSH